MKKSLILCSILFLFVGCSSESKKVKVIDKNRDQVYKEFAVDYCKTKFSKLATKEQIDEYYLANKEELEKNEDKDIGFLYRKDKKEDLSITNQKNVYIPKTKELETENNGIFSFSLPYTLCVK